MSDDKKKFGEPDKSTINMHEAYEVDYWVKKWRISRATLQLAVNAVGKSSAHVEAWLRKNGHI